MFGKVIAAAVLSAGLALAAPATAATTITLTGSSPLSGTAGNVLTFNGAGGLQVKASAWSYSGSTLASAYLGAYGNGLGVTNANEGSGGNNSHAVDNNVGRDFILLIFNQAVNLTSGIFRPYSQTSAGTDNDARISVTNVAGLFSAPPLAASNAVFTTLQSNGWNVSGNTSSPFNINFGTNQSGNVWLIGAASPSSDQIADGFKLNSVTVAAVPEPGTWLMMLLGFGLVGSAMRRGRNRLLGGRRAAVA